ncbi:hypothetical protein [Neptunomonas sp.]|uniref:hypothetical protein n=1 Tax=Neptunomonas sp. TaxID=1971898 RepID=UPI003568B436
MEWKKESNYVVHESGFTVIVEEGSFNEPSTIRINQADGFSAIEQAKLLRQGIEFGRSKIEVDSKRVAPRENNGPRITVKKSRKTRIPGPTE